MGEVAAARAPRPVAPGLAPPGRETGGGGEKSSSHGAAPMRQNHAEVSSADVDAYFAGVAEPGRTTLQALRETIRSILPDAEEVISYGCPAFRLNGKVVAGYAAFVKHLSYLPHSGSVIAKVPEAKAYKGTAGSLHFPLDKPLPESLVRKLVEVKRAEIAERGRRG